MTEDIVEFGAPPAPRAKRAPRKGRPLWLNNRMLPVAVGGAIAGAGSMILPWQKLVVRLDRSSEEPVIQNTYEAFLITFGAHGPSYLITLIATITAVVLIFYGHQGVPLARVVGGTLSGINLVILATMAIALSKGTSVNAVFLMFGPVDLSRMTISLDWGFYAALAAVFALGAAALRAQPLSQTEASEESGPAEEGEATGGDPGGELDDDGVIDLSVSVHPVGKQVAAG